MHYTSQSEQLLRSIADPRQTLPEVELRLLSQGYDIDIFAAHALEERVGTMRIGKVETDEAFVVMGSHIDEQLQGRGYGLAMYLGAAALAYDSGFRLKSDEMVSRDAAKVWIRLQNKGLARIQKPFQWRGPEQYSHVGRAAFVPMEQLRDLHAEARADLEREGVGSRLAAAGFEAANGRDHGAVVGAELRVSVFDEDIW